MSKLRGVAVEVNLTEHCNLRCRGCDHASPHLPERFLPLETFRRDLEALAQVLELEEVKLVGGEPLMHPQLVDFLRTARSIGIAERLTIVTNGVLLHELSDELWEHVDRMWVSLYPGIKHRVDFDQLARTAERHGVELWLKKSPAFGLVLLNRKNEDAGLVEQIYLRCRAAHLMSCHTVHEGYYFKCSPAPFIGARLAQIGIAVDNRQVDGVRIHDNPDLEGELGRYLGSREPLTACSYCLGSVGKLRPSAQLNRASLAGELREDHSGVIELIDWEAFHRPWEVPSAQLPELPPWIDELETRRRKLAEGDG